jgi:hypothetical protein
MLLQPVCLGGGRGTPEPTFGSDQSSIRWPHGGRPFTGRHRAHQGARLEGAVRPKTVARSASTSGTKGRLFQGTRTACCAG